MPSAIQMRQIVRLVLVVFLLLAARTPANAASWFVTGQFGSDANACNAPNASCRTINGAIAKSQAGDWIYVTAGIYTGTGPDAIVHVDKSLTILGGWDLGFSKTPVGFTILNGEHQRQGLVVDKGADLAVSDVAIIWGFGGDGGGADVEGGLWGTRMLIVQNKAFRGGGIYFNARVGTNLALVHSVLYANEYYVDGGGLFVDGFRHDDPSDPYHVNGATLYVTTVSNNIAINSVDEEHGTLPNYGGGVYVHDGFLDLVHTTFAENTHWDGRNFTQDNAGIGADGGGFIDVRNTLVADGCHVQGAFFIISEGNNIERLNSCFLSHPDDRASVNPLIFPANVNPGPYSTITHAIAWNSPAAQWAEPQWCGPKGPGNYDQRGVPRPQGFLCDVGAYERLLDEQGSISHPGASPGTLDQCPTLSWDARGRSRPNRCRLSDAALIRSLLGPSFAVGRGHRHDDEPENGDDDLDRPVGRDLTGRPRDAEWMSFRERHRE